MITTGPQLESIITRVQDYCADILESGCKWTATDGEHVAALFNESDDPYELFRFVDEQTGSVAVGYHTRDGREWFSVLRQMRNTVGSGLLENLRGLQLQP